MKIFIRWYPFNFNRGFRPKCVTKSLELYKELEETLESRTEITNAIKITKTNCRLDDWIDYSKKGLYSYDLRDVHRVKQKKQFDILFKPEKPLKITDINLDKFSDVIPVFDFEFGTDLSFKKLENGLLQ